MTTGSRVWRKLLREATGIARIRSWSSWATAAAPARVLDLPDTCAALLSAPNSATPMTATSTAETSTSMSSEPRSSARLRDGVEIMSVTTQWSRRARGRGGGPAGLRGRIAERAGRGWTDGLPANEDGPAQRDLAPAAVDGLAGDEHGHPRGALEAAERAARQADRDDGGAGLLELDRRPAEQIRLRLGLREPQAPSVGGLQAGGDGARGRAVGAAAQAQSLLAHELQRLDRRAVETPVERRGAGVGTRRAAARAARAARAPARPPRAAGPAGATLPIGRARVEARRAAPGAAARAGRRVDDERAARDGGAPVVVRGPHADAHDRRVGEAARDQRRGAAVGLVAAVAVEIPLVANDRPVVGRAAGVEADRLAGDDGVRRGEEGRRGRRGGDHAERRRRRALRAVAVGHAQLDRVAAGRGEVDAGPRDGVVVEVVVAVGLPLVARDRPAVGVVVRARAVERRVGLLLDPRERPDDRVRQVADDEVDRRCPDDARGVADADRDGARAALGEAHGPRCGVVVEAGAVAEVPLVAGDAAGIGRGRGRGVEGDAGAGVDGVGRRGELRHRARGAARGGDVQGPAVDPADLV